MEFKEIIAVHRSRYPMMQGQDWAKLCYQAEFGAGHMIADTEACFERLRKEYLQTDECQGLLFEEIGGGLSRLNLGPLHHEGVSLRTVAWLFEIAAQPRGDLDGLEEKLRLTQTPENADYFNHYRDEGCPAVSHSQIYRDAYHPAYRVVPDWARVYWELIKAIDRLTAQKDLVTVAIDGMSGSGKTTLGLRLRELFGGNLFHMDDFFLPFERKTPQRLRQPGGNVDHERFRAEVLEPLKRGEPFTFKPYLCHKGALGEAVAAQPQKLNIVEGCYSLHPQMEGNYDLKVFLKLTADEQSRRILQRNGEAMLKRFQEEWIPLENMYFSAFAIEKQCDLVFR